jgi:hypothetical protein
MMGLAHLLQAVVVLIQTLRYLEVLELILALIGTEQVVEREEVSVIQKSITLQLMLQLPKTTQIL